MSSEKRIPIPEYVLRARAAHLLATEQQAKAAHAFGQALATWQVGHKGGEDEIKAVLAAMVCMYGARLETVLVIEASEGEEP